MLKQCKQEQCEREREREREKGVQTSGTIEVSEFMDSKPKHKIDATNALVHNTTLPMRMEVTTQRGQCFKHEGIPNRVQSITLFPKKKKKKKKKPMTDK